MPASTALLLATVLAAPQTALEGLTAEPYRHANLGVSIHLPMGSAVSNERVNLDEAIVVQNQTASAEESPRWSMRIGRLVTPEDQLMTPARLVDDQLQRLRATGAAFRVLRNEPVTIGGRTSQVCYIETASEGGQPFVSGRVYIASGPTGSGRFHQVSIVTLPSNYPTVAPLLDRSIATMTVRSEREIMNERVQALEAGRHLLETASEHRLRALVGHDEWMRIHHPTGGEGGGEQEIGWTHLTINEGRRGDLNPGRPTSEFTALELEHGLIVRVESRYILDAASREYFDSVGIFWTAWDSSSEAWSIRATRRRGREQSSESETGFRDARRPGDPDPLITVVRASDNFDRSSATWPKPDIYLPHGFSWIVGHLLPREGSEPVEYGYYTYNGTGARPSISLRRDSWTPMGDGTGRWEQRTRLTVETPPSISIFDSSGQLVRKTRHDGSLVEPIDLALLRRIWQRKGLDLSSARRR